MERNERRKMKITVFGTGAYGIALALMLAKKKENNILMWTQNESKLEEFRETKRFDSIFPSLEIPSNIDITNSYEEAIKNTNLIFFVTSAKYLYDTCKKIEPYYKNQHICIASKGINDYTLNTLSELVRNTLKTRNISFISGPTFAIDLVHNEPCALAIAGLNSKTINLVKNSLANETLKLRKSSDIIGIQLCGSIKNIIAIASGILAGLGYQESTRAFLINESLHDIKNIIHYLGGKKKTILSFAGIGDLMLTCTSTKSRNYSFGYVIGSTKDKEKIEEYLKNNTVEGYYTLDSVYRMLQKKGINIPLITLIYNIVVNNQNPEDLATFLISKD